MKDNNKYVLKLKKLFTVLKKGNEKLKKPVYDDVIEAVVFAVLCEKSPESSAKAALKKIQSHFVDFNDLRVARIEEITEVIGHDIEESERCAAKLTSLLNAVFQKYDCLSLEEPAAGGKKGLREILEKFNGATNFISSYCLLTVAGTHCVPLTEKMIQYLKTYDVVDGHLENEQIAGFVEKQITAANSYTFYAMVRHDSELVNPKAAALLSEKKTKTDKKIKVKKQG
jgi:hypothetical protein